MLASVDAIQHKTEKSCSDPSAVFGEALRTGRMLRSVTQLLVNMILVAMKANQDEIKAPQPFKLPIYLFKPNRLHFSRCRAVLRTTWRPARKHAPLEKPCSLQNCRRRFAVRSAVPRKKTHNRG